MKTLKFVKFFNGVDSIVALNEYCKTLKIGTMLGIQPKTGPGRVQKGHIK